MCDSTGRKFSPINFAVSASAYDSASSRAQAPQPGAALKSIRTGLISWRACANAASTSSIQSIAMYSLYVAPGRSLAGLDALPMTRPILARHVDAELHSERRPRRTESRRNRARARRLPQTRNQSAADGPADPPDGGMFFCRTAMINEKRVAERRPQPRMEARIFRAVILRLLVQEVADAVFNRRTHRVPRESGTDPFAEPRDAASPFFGVIDHLTPDRARAGAHRRARADERMPIVPCVVRFAFRRRFGTYSSGL